MGLFILKYSNFFINYRNNYIKNLWLLLISTKQINTYNISNSFRKFKYNCCLSTSSSKRKSLINKSGKKPWAQKGLGKARAGDMVAPNWKGGGVAFGPLPKVSTYKINSKEILKVLSTILVNKRSNLIPWTINLNCFFNILKLLGISYYEKILFIIPKYYKSIKLLNFNTFNYNNIKIIDFILNDYLIFLF